MRGLYFYAAAARPAAVVALMGQAATTLRPFERFLSQAIHTAKERQARYQLPWAPVVETQILRLEAQDSVVWVPRRRSAWRIRNWPVHVEPDLMQKFMVVSRGIVLDVVECFRVADGLHVRTAGELADGDQVFWCGQKCELTRTVPHAPPAEVRTVRGAEVRQLRQPQEDGDGWVLVLAGRSTDGELLIDGELAETRDVSPIEGVRRLRDSEGLVLEISGGLLKVETLPADGPLVADNGVRFAWRAERPGRGRTGAWVQLLTPDGDDADEGDEFLDPRAAFCEGDVESVWTQAKHDKESVYKVKRVDQERYQILLDRLPPPESRLFLPVDVRSLYLQQRALRQLRESPLPHHQGLLRLCEDPAQVRWPAVEPQEPEEWKELTDTSRDGTDEQRRFVAKALGTPDLAFLEGPPGSGKTTAICELIQQFVADGKKVLLCASTNVAIDNVIERLLDVGAPVDAVRIGRPDRVDDKVMSTQIDRRVEDLVAAWSAAPHLRSFGDAELRSMAERTVMMSANLTCGTTMGIVNHPLFRDEGRDPRPWEKPITRMPHWDVLIVDEASKTLIQEFLVPALMAVRWIIVGDVRQLPPFADRADILANLRSLVDMRERAVFPPEHQRACLLLFRLTRRELRDAGARWLIVEPAAVLDWLDEEVAKEGSFPLSVVRVVATARGQPTPFHEVSIADVVNGSRTTLLLAACDWVLCGEDLVARVAAHLPCDLIPARDLTRGTSGMPADHAMFFRHEWWLERAGRLRCSYRERGEEISTFRRAAAHEQRWLHEHDLAGEMAWRLTRLHELRRSRDRRERSRLVEELERLQPVAADISEPVAEIQDIGLPSVLEVLQEGIGVERSSRPSALTEGIPRRQPRSFADRFESLSYQHRMHADISAFPRKWVYEESSLQDANTVGLRDSELGWTFGPFRGRRAWIDVRGREAGGVNADEVRVMEGVVRAFIDWAAAAGPPRRSRPTLWEVACIAFYNRQIADRERGVAAMLRRVTGDDRLTRFATGNVEIVCGTVDRFQGREADLVVLSMRNTRRVGFLDSVNRLNVAVTRARQQLVVLGNADYFGQCGITELQELVRSSPREASHQWVGARR